MSDDSGVIDLFAIQKEEEARIPSPVSAPPPAVTLDNDVDDIEGFAAEQQKNRKRVKIIGAAIGGVTVVGILLAAIFSGGAEPPKAAAKLPPPVASAPPPPPVAPPPVAPPSADTANAKPDYTPATAASAFAQTQPKKKSGKHKAGGARLQKVQSSGTH